MDPEDPLEAFWSEVAELGSALSVIDFDDSAEGAEARQLQRNDELESLSAIFGDQMERISDNLIRFMIYKETEPTQPLAPLEELHIAFLLHEEYPAFPVVFEMQGACLRFDEADRIFFELFNMASESAGDPVVFSMVNCARELVQSAIAARPHHAPSNHGLSASKTHELEEEDGDACASDAHASAAPSFEREIRMHMSDPGYFLQCSISEVIDEVKASSNMAVLRVENVLRYGFKS